MDGDVIIHQVPTLWNYSDVGTKSLPRSRLLFLLCGIGMVEADTAEPFGLEEYNNMAEQETNRREISKLAAGKDFEKNHITHDSAGPWAGGCRRC